ncbi:hypothetical protein BASA62_003497 [Batrachochytrium salamandrivorans]|nr:hypothetical protein BASA62_003497 [Batrachochytrium salamandrivorans]
MASTESKETNITVVVRVRPRNQKEIRENSPVCVSTTSNKKELQLRMNQGSFSSASSLNSTSSQDSIASKSFLFDRVFGPEVSQEALFNEVASGILSEVLMGYNCTIFAYGQTGTGKTHTMEGDLSTEGSPNAGIIPRTLYSLFDTLERETGEYSVRVSFIELYNEEIKDLLTPDDDSRKLKIFDDRRGSTLIQGLEEILVKNAVDVISILQTGSNRRQKAATKLNHVSSRSHGIFSITVHTKECTPDGEELLKVGKLNLVDLAGSENIGRSGAENKRAKEAGMINQSLLTLGRVIGALVEHNSHIPYRESKLTRILQDSLGGRTKTCIIAAVSPAKCNIEESMSTLDYAHRAKNIRNKPEINQRMTKKALLREYITEIERLKSDLTATREKNGIYISKESYSSLMEENQSRKDHIDEVTSAIALKETQIAALEQQFKTKVDDLEQTSLQLTETMSELQERKKELSIAAEDIKLAKCSLMEQEFLTRAHASTESHLDLLAGSLVSTLASSVNDVHGLHDKLDRKRAIDNENTTLFSEFQVKVGFHLDGMLSRVHQFDKQFQNTHLEMASTIQESLQQSDKTLLNIKAIIVDTVKDMSDSGTIISNANLEIARESLNQTSRISDAADTLKSLLASNNEKIFKSMEDMKDIMKNRISEQEVKMKQMVQCFADSLVSLSKTAETTMEGVLADRDRQHELIQSQLTKQLEQLSSYNRLLEKRLTDDETLAQNEKASFLEKISAELDAITILRSKRQEALASDFIDQAMTQFQSIGEFREVLSTEHTTNAQKMQEFGTLLHDGLLDTSSGCSSICQSASQDKDELIYTSESTLAPVKEIICTSTASLDDQLGTLFSTLHKNTESIYRQATKQQSYLEEQEQSRNVLSESATDNVDSVSTQLACSLQDIQTQADSLLREDESLRDDLQKLHSTIKPQVEKVELHPDTPTGKTPRRRAINIPTSWKRTRDHEDLLREFNARQRNGTDESINYTSIIKHIDTSPFSFVENVTGKAAEAAEWENPSGLSHLQLVMDDDDATMSSCASPDQPVPQCDAPSTPGPVSKLPRSRQKRNAVTFDE